MTSHDCVAQVRRILHTKKVGHGGTLDPNVTGVLPIVVGKGTKLLEYLHRYPKTYYGEITLGIATETEDSDGAVIAKADIDDMLDTALIDQAMACFVGDIQQTPPMYSAVKVDGKRLYEYAREGKTVQRPSRTVEIKQFKRQGEPVYHQDTKTMTWPFIVTCSKGTYIRTLAVDLGKSLGYPAHMSRLTRLSSGGFQAGQAMTLQQLQEHVDKAPTSMPGYPLEIIVEDFPRYIATDKDYQRIKNGNTLPLTEDPSQEVAVYYKQQLVAIYAYRRPNEWGVSKMIHNDL